MKRTLPLLPVLLLLALAACGDDDSESAKPGAAARMEGAKPEALTSARKVVPADPDAGRTVPLRAANARKPAARKEIDSLVVRRRGGLQAGPEPTEAEYDRFVAAILPVIDSFWSEQTKKVSTGAEYEPPGHLVSYNLKDSPGCQGDKSADMSRNAYYCNSVEAPDKCQTVSKNGIYCSKGDIIAWDKQGLMFPYYREIGNLAPAIVFAHEWGHLAQFRIFPEYKYRTTIRNELQADCYAGAWALDQERRGHTSVGDFNQAISLFYDIGGGDQSWLDERSHGNKFQRTRAFVQGFEEDVQGCIGEAFDKRLARLGLPKEAPAAPEDQ